MTSTPEDILNLGDGETSNEQFMSGSVISSYEAEDGKSLVLVVKSVTDEFVEMEMLEKYHHTLVGKEIRWRHVQPELFSGSFLGVTRKTWIDGKQLMSEVEIYGDTDEQKKVQEYIKKQIKDGKPVGVSVGFIRIFDENENTSRVFFREQSITPFPHCPTCGVVKVVTAEEEKKDKGTPFDLPDNAGINVSLPPNFKGVFHFESGKKDEESKEEEDEDEEMKEEEDEDEKDDKSKSGNEEKERKRKMPRIDEYESRIAQLESRNSELESQLQGMKDRVIELEVQKEIMGSLPKRLRIAKLEGLTDPAEQQKRANELLVFEDTPGPSGKSQLDMMLESLERMASRTTQHEGTSGGTPVVSTRLRSTGKLSEMEIGKMSPDDILKNAGYT